MFLSQVTDGGATPALIKTMAFNESRLKVIADNVANSATPGYRAKQLDARAFQRALGRAMDSRGGDRTKPLVVQSGREVTTDENGRLKVRPTERPVDNVLFHDGTNLSLEREMADLAETGMMHQLAAELLRGNFDAYRKAIRGTV